MSPLHAAGPARCAGLRHALLHDWQRGFPVEGSPFQVLARQLGGSLRELMGHCRALSEEGALEAIRVHWGPCLERVRWRCGVPARAARAGEMARSLAALPGVTGWDRLDFGDAPGDEGAAALPALWFDIVARHREAAGAQLAWFEARHGPVVRLELEGTGTAPDCRCPLHDGPCSDTALARRCEAGLPLVAHPYRTLSEGLQRSEREVMARLRRWQRAGRLAALGLRGPGQSERLATVAGLAGEAVDASLRAALLARPGVAEVQALPGHPDWPFVLLVTGTGAAAQAAEPLERALAACGLGARPRRLWRVHSVRLRAAPLLFADIADIADLEHIEGMEKMEGTEGSEGMGGIEDIEGRGGVEGIADLTDFAASAAATRPGP